MRLLKELLQRRVPQLVGLYLGVSWGIIQFIDWFVNRYSMSPHLTEFGLVTLASLVPTVILVAYFHGRPGHDQWARAEKIGIPLNVVLAAGILFLTFQGKDLGATTTQVTVRNEDGKTIERHITKRAFRKRILSFFFDNNSGDPKKDWVQYAIPFLMDLDLSQDHFLSVSNSYESYQKLKNAGYDAGVHLPLTLKTKIASNLHMQYFVSGSFTIMQDTFFVDVALYEAQRGKLVTEHLFKNIDMFEIADEMSLQLKRDLDLPKGHIEEITDLPVKERVTSSLSAFREYILGLNSIVLKQDWSTAITHLEQAIADDSTFALAYSQLQSGYVFANQSEKLSKIVPPLMQHLYKLPERAQLFVKQFYYYNIKQDADRGYNVIKMWAELYPDDIEAHEALAEVYRQKNQLQNAIAEYERILELDPERFDTHHVIGTVYKSLGDFERSLEHYQLFAERSPNNVKSFKAIGALNMTVGNYKEAKSYYEKAFVLEPQDVQILLSLARIEKNLGNLTEAEEQFQEALDGSKSPQDRLEVYDELVDFAEARGQLKQALEYTELKLAEGEKFLPPIIALMQKLQNLDKHIKVGNTEFALQKLEEIKAQTQPPFDKTLPLGDLRVYLALENAERAQRAVAGVDTLIRTFQIEILRPIALNAQGRIHELQGEYDLAIRSFEKQIQMDPTDIEIHREIGRCHRKSGNLKKAKQHLQKTLEVLPHDPHSNHEAALVYWELGERDKALECLKNAVGFWRDADPDFEPAQEAQARLVEWEGSTILTESG